MNIQVRKDGIVLQPETEAKHFQLEWVAKSLEDLNLQSTIKRQWVVTQISLPLKPQLK